jgi:ribosome-binding factor A
VSFLLTDPKATYELINDHKKEIRHHLSKRIGKSVRVIPEIAFFPDDSATYAQYMDKVISDLNIPPAPTVEEEDEDDQD